ncbi:MAG: beta-lactamase family protein [Desulfomonile tiedjei]|nr:beta-lactamase family protein [Desulfomonile tiedjei]
MTFEQVDDLMVGARQDRLFTAAALFVSRRGERLFLRSYGTLGGPGTGPVTTETLFDLASLTKVVVTTPCWMLLASQNPGLLDEPLSKWFPELSGPKARITPRWLLAHSSGLPAWRPYYLYHDGKSLQRLVRQVILCEELAYTPGEGCLYSDLGFMVLAAIAELEAGAPLERFAARELFEPLRVDRDVLFTPPDDKRGIALTRPGEPAGLVNDLNTRVLHGVSGHAGAFGTAEAVAVMAEEVLKGFRSESRLLPGSVSRTFCRRADLVPGSTRALGFDTPSEEGSAGGHFLSRESVGHTGFTGTSLWIDLDRELVVVLLTNRVFMGESDQRIKSFRPRIHDTIVREVI